MAVGAGHSMPNSQDDACHVPPTSVPSFDFLQTFYDWIDLLIILGCPDVSLDETWVFYQPTHYALCCILYVLQIESY
jgi:hypothetical protein